MTLLRWPSSKDGSVVRARRLAFFLAGDAAVLAASLYAGLHLRFEGSVPLPLLTALPAAWALSMALKVPFLYRQGSYSVSWSFVGIEDLLGVLQGVTFGWVSFVALMTVLDYAEVLPRFPRSVLILDYVFTLLGIWAFRISRRLYSHVVPRRRARGEPTLLVGAGSTGEQMVRSLLATPGSVYLPVGFVDDDPAKQGAAVHSVPVLGGRAAIPELVQRYAVTHVFLAMPSAPHGTVREVISLARAAGVKDVRIVPGLTKLLDGQVSLADLREVRLEDLLGRPVASIDIDRITTTLKGKRVLVTGAGGSIGGELCRQVLRFRPQSLILLDHEETALFEIHRELASGHANSTTHLVPVLADIRDKPKTTALVRTLAPEIIFHAAAYKHVALLEHHPDEAVRTNVLGTAVLAEAAVAAGAERFILLSTDKAVTPVSVMGATKRVAEQLCLMFNHHGRTRFMAVRFGNVLGSRGSVVPIFQEQIRRGGPVTVRGPDVRRYFMATSEAVLLVLQATAIGRGGEVFVLDMGQPIKVADLARELIRLSGLEPDRDIPIVYTELEPGEKEFEDILSAEEGTRATQHEQIYVASLSSTMTEGALLARVADLCQAADQRVPGRIIQVLQELVPTYNPSNVAAGRTTPASQWPGIPSDARRDVGAISIVDSWGKSSDTSAKAAP